MRKRRAADLFCGAGGTTTGAVMSGQVDVVFALNHSEVAIATHSANNPGTRHVNSRIETTSPSECGKIDILFASPECTHHSKARGGKPTSDQQRSGSWDVLKWIEHHRPSHVIVENVWEITKWGPVGSNGKPLKKFQGCYFDLWIKAIQGSGYKVDFQKLNAANYGAATSRERFILMARKGNRNPVWPDTTHAADGVDRQRWRAAYEVIDWRIPCPSIFNRPGRDLADNTLSRIEAGLRRFVGPFVTQWDNASVKDPSRSIGQPLKTMVTKANMGIAIPFQYQLIGRGAGRSRDIGDSMPTIIGARENHGICLPFISKQYGTKNGTYNPSVCLESPLGAITTIDHNAIALPYMLDVNHAVDGHTRGRTADVCDPFGAVTAKRGKAIAIPWLSHYYGTENISPILDPVDTITTKDRHALAIATYRGPQEWPKPKTAAMRSLQKTMRELGVCDVGFRMLENAELAAAQSFPPEYVFIGNKSQVTKQIGNSVPPLMAKALSLSVCG